MPLRRQTSRPLPSLKRILDSFYKGYDFKKRLQHDPVEFPHRYSSPDDAESAAFISSCLAYGKVGLFKPVIEKILKPCGKHPAEFFMNFNLRKDSKYFRGISYRFNKEEDILCLVYILHRILNQHGSIRNLFYHYYMPEHEDIKNALTGFTDYLLKIDIAPGYKVKGIRSPASPFQFFPSPENGSACKRMNLFLRWMVRPKDVDLGIWDNIPPSKLIIPLDTHLSRISKCLGLTERQASDWKTAKEITGSLKKFDPEDPLKYDFALCHQGISRLCKGQKFKEICAACALLKGQRIECRV